MDNANLAANHGESAVSDMSAQRRILSLGAEGSAIDESLNSRVESNEEFLVVFCDRATDAIHLLDYEAIDVILIDVELTSFDGLEFMAHISRSYPEVPIIVVSRYISHVVMGLIRRSGVTTTLSFLKPPLDDGRLLDTVQQALASWDQPENSGIPLAAFLHLVDAEHRTAIMRVVRSDGVEGRLWFDQGELFAAATPELRGKMAVLDMLRWSHGQLWIEDVQELSSVERSVHAELNGLLVEGLRKRPKDSPAPGRSLEPIVVERNTPRLATVSSASLEQVHLIEKNDPSPPSDPRSLSEILEEILTLPDVAAAVLATRDGFVIEYVGSWGNLKMGSLVAAAGVMLAGVEQMLDVLELDAFTGMTLESQSLQDGGHDNDTLVGWPIGGALLIVLAGHAKYLGRVRTLVRKHVVELHDFF